MADLAALRAVASAMNARPDGGATGGVGRLGGMADHTTDTSAETDLIDHDVLERVLGAALRTGGEFAEVFAEDKRSSSAGLDDGKVEQLTSRPRPRRRHPGRRRRDHRLRPHRRPHRGRACAAAAEAAAAAARGRAAAAPTPSPSPRQHARRVNAVEQLSRRRRQGRQGRAAAAGRRGRPRQRAAPSSRSSAGYGDSRKRILVANTDGLLADDDQVRTLLRDQRASPPATPACRPASESIGHTVGFELFDTLDVEELARDAARQALTKLDARPAPSRARCRS